jgi:nicotinic acid mononucleotide adenylyltransferase
MHTYDADPEHPGARHVSARRHTAGHKPESPLIQRAMEATCRIFDRLGTYSYLDAQDREGFSYYSSFYCNSLMNIDRRIIAGELEPVDLSDFPQIVRFPSYTIQAALFIGSFDPFQMTHLAVALRYLSSSMATAPVVFVVPEGSDNARKPRKCDYRYRFDLLSMQVSDIFSPLIVPLDIGEGADTIEIIRRFIAMFPGARVSLTHLLGSDVLPLAVEMLPQDMRVWNAEAERRHADFSYKAFVVQREGYPVSQELMDVTRAASQPIHIDDQPICTPSSTDFREHRAFSIVFPTDAAISHLEVLFRYNLNKPWSSCCDDDSPVFTPP